MTFRDYLILMSIGTTLACIGFIVVLFTIDPTQTSFVGFLIFYLTLALSSIGLFAILGSLLRHWRKRDSVLTRIAIKSLRQSVLLSLLLIGCILLLSHNIFRWWIILLLVLFLGVIETICSRSKR